MRKHGKNCDCGMCKIGKAVGMIEKPDHNDHDHDHEHDENHNHEAK